MSRIGKKPILIPEGVEVKIEDHKVIINGPKGEFSKEIRPELKIEIKENKIFVLPYLETKKTKVLWGTTRAFLENLLKGVTNGYEKKLQIDGLGYRAQLNGENLLLYIGLSHPVEIKTVSGIKFSVEKNIITVSGIDKELVGKIAADIKKMRPVEPYKGKGIKYLGEVVKRKVGKKAVAAAK